MSRQLWHGFAIIAALGGHTMASPTFFTNSAGNATMVERSMAGFGVAQFSTITRMAAIGDSYSAGIGAGDRMQSPWIGLAQEMFGNVNNGKSGSCPLNRKHELTHVHQDYGCSRYDHSYPHLLNDDDRLGNPAARKFQFLSCSGAVINDVLNKQIPNLEDNQQVILLSAGMYTLSFYYNIY
jgi:hypothetical protein